MGIAFLDVRSPLNVFVDRSRDQVSGYALVRLSPQALFHVSDNQRRLTEAALRGYDALGICGVSALPYAAAELRAIERFVRRGGTLILASSSGTFEFMTGRPIDDLAHQRVAHLFGYAFRPAGNLPRRPSGMRGLGRDSLELTDAGARSGLRIGDCWLNITGTIDVPADAVVLMRNRLTGAAVMAMSSHGRGRVLVCNDLATWSNANAFAAAHWVALAAPQRRKQARNQQPPGDRLQPVTKVRDGRITYHTTPLTADALPRVWRLAPRVIRELLSMFHLPKPPKTFTVDIVNGAGSWVDWQHDDPLVAHIGASLSDAGIVSELVQCFGMRMAYARLRHELRSYLQMDDLQARVLRRLGFHAMAEEIEVTASGGAAVDLSRLYTEIDPPRPLRRFWRDVDAAFGADTFSKFCKALPKENPTEGIDLGLFTPLDVVAYYIGRGIGDIGRVCRWLRQQGHTVRQLPDAAPKSEAFKAGLERLMRRMIVDDVEPASDRFDAVTVLARRLGEKKIGFDACVRQARSRTIATALPAAARLASARDARGAEPLRQMLDHDDTGLAAVAALLLVFEYADPAAADALVRLAPGKDTRFQLSAGHALRLMSDPRAASFAFDRLPECSLQRNDEGMIKVFPVVDGYQVANVWCQPIVRPAAHGQGYSAYYVQWVHTAPRWRRRGLARIGMTACLDDHWDRACAMTSLHTGTRNVAHALYRDYGLIDYYRGVRFEKELRREHKVNPPKGITIRRANQRDIAQATKVVAADRHRRPIDRPYDPIAADGRVAYVASRGAKIVGYASASITGRSATLIHLGTADLSGKQEQPDGQVREQMGAALLSALQRDLIGRRIKRIETNFWQPIGSDATYWLLRRSGYGSQEMGGVELYRMNSLRQYLQETAGALETRLRDSRTFATWRGSVLVQSGTQHALIRCNRGEISVQDGTVEGEPPTVTIRGDEQALQRLVTGISSCFQEYLQIHVQARPLINDEVRDLLDCLFPRMIAR